MRVFDLNEHTGLTHVIDKGLGTRSWEDVLEVSGDLISIVKLGWGTAAVTQKLERKLEVLRKAGKPVELSTTEFKVLRYFLRNPGKVLSKTQILEHVWSYEFRGDLNIVETYVSHLRRKIDTTQPRLLHTLRGVGYTLRVPKK